MDGEHVININELVISVNREHNSGWPRSRSGGDETGVPAIHRINQYIRDKPENAFLPYILSIGPYNYGARATHAMQKKKYEFLNHTLNLKHRKGLPDFLEPMKQLEKKVKSCYTDEITMDKNDFCKMLLLDGCFIFIFLKGIETSMPEMQESSESNREIEGGQNMNNARGIMNEDETREAKSLNSQCNARYEADEDYSSSHDLLYNESYRHDLLLLENQIPFFVIKTIHEIIAGGSDKTSKLTENVVEFVENALSCYPKAICKSNRPKTFHHLLHLCHMYFKPCWAKVDSDTYHLQPPPIHNLHQLRSNSLERINQRSFDQGLPWRRAIKYHQAGIGFKKRTFFSENPHSLLDILFCNGVIEIPCLTIELNTYSLFCNLIAFEQTCPQFGSFVTTYIMFLSHLISMQEDVSLLTERGIIVHQLDSDAELSNLFMMISECIVSDFNNNSYLKSLYDRLEEHYQSQKPIIREFLTSITSKVRNWTQKSEISDLPLSMPTKTSI